VFESISDLLINGDVIIAATTDGVLSFSLESGNILVSLKGFFS
jgi:hypothetical protein